MFEESWRVSIELLVGESGRAWHWASEFEECKGEWKLCRKEDEESEFLEIVEVWK